MPVAHYCHGGKGKNIFSVDSAPRLDTSKMFGFADIVTESTKIGYNSNTSEESTSGQT